MKHRHKWKRHITWFTEDYEEEAYVCQVCDKIKHKYPMGRKKIEGAFLERPWK